jgi:hypothetical protein
VVIAPVANVSGIEAKRTSTRFSMHKEKSMPGYSRRSSNAHPKHLQLECVAARNLESVQGICQTCGSFFMRLRPCVCPHVEPFNLRVSMCIVGWHFCVPLSL